MPFTKEGIDKVNKATKEVAQRIFTFSQENLIRDGRIDTSKLFLSGSIREEGDEVIIIYDAPHAKAAEFGSKPHWTSHKNLIPWVRRKLGIKNEKEAEKVAYAIAANIAKRGTEPMFFMKKAIEQAKVK